jgi:sodium/bile acid cotransporter 7
MSGKNSDIELSSVPSGADADDIKSLEEEEAKPSSTGLSQDDEGAKLNPIESSTGETSKQPEPESESTGGVLKCLCTFYGNNSFLILVLTVILLAYAYPPLGATYLAPQITATWIAVMIIFLLSGISLKSEEFAKALQRLNFNIFVQVFNFGIVSSITYGFSRAMISAGALSQSLADGMVIGTCVPITVNMVLVLTKSSSGDEAAAVFNAAFGNLTGVFLSPALVLGYLGVKGAVDLGTVFYKLGLRVLLPLTIGQILHKYSTVVVDFVKKNKKYFKKVQEYCLIFIIYTVFCKTFTKETDTEAKEVFIMIAFQFILLSSVMMLAWLLLKLAFPEHPKLRVMGLVRKHF